MNSEERRDALGETLVSIDYRLQEVLDELEEHQTPPDHLVIRTRDQYGQAEFDLLEGLSRQKSIEYLQAKSKLMAEHVRAID